MLGSAPASSTSRATSSLHLQRDAPGVATAIPVMDREEKVSGARSLSLEGPLQEHDVLVFVQADGGAADRHRPAIKPRVKFLPAAAEPGTLDPPLARMPWLARGTSGQRCRAVGVETHEVW